MRLSADPLLVSASMNLEQLLCRLSPPVTGVRIQSLIRTRGPEPHAVVMVIYVSFDGMRNRPAARGRSAEPVTFINEFFRLHKNVGLQYIKQACSPRARPVRGVRWLGGRRNRDHRNQRSRAILEKTMIHPKLRAF